MIWFGWVLWHTSKIVSIHIYWIYMISFDCISTIVGYLIPKPLYIEYMPNSL